jgi:hypothetical protein
MMDALPVQRSVVSTFGWWPWMWEDDPVWMLVLGCCDRSWCDSKAPPLYHPACASCCAVARCLIATCCRFCTGQAVCLCRARPSDLKAFDRWLLSLVTAAGLCLID